MRVSTQRSKHAPQTDKKESFLVERLQRKLREAESFAQWDEIRRIITHERFSVPHKLIIYEFIAKCPKTMEELRTEFMEDFRANVYDRMLPNEIDMRLHKILALVQAGSFYSPAEYFTQKTYALLAYKVLDRPVPAELRERMMKCEEIQRRGKNITISDLTKAGYEEKEVQGRQIVLVHPKTGDSVTLFGEKVPQAKVSKSGHVIAGVLPMEEQLRRAKENAKRNEEARRARKIAPKKVKVKVVVEDDSKGKGKGGKKGASKGSKGKK